jgi:hypothetical protein
MRCRNRHGYILVQTDFHYKPRVARFRDLRRTAFGKPGLYKRETEASHSNMNRHRARTFALTLTDRYFAAGLNFSK